ncbi:hypothetical protein LTR56_010336 [Elasticomyces elasticus]|nr:hypothetical protein LTR56_010336 [Elasticomyces elasticus]KAK3656904.1 hypothetical protein LTR22_009566 [Elasticomyces elasticus]KAK5766136.1 hypothetical protein LTS12_003619 [Elasticomyces elasticus]
MDDMASLQRLLPYALSAEVLSGGFLTSHADADGALLSPVYPARLEELHSEAGACKSCPSLSELTRGLEAIFRSMWSTEEDVDKYAGIEALLGSYRTTKERFCGLGPMDSKAGDEVWLLPGLRAPIVLRRLQNDHRMVVGEAYVHGFMLGEAFENGILRECDRHTVCLE